MTRPRDAPAQPARSAAPSERLRLGFAAWAGAVALAGAQLLAACGAFAPPAGPSTIRIGHESDPISLDPAAQQEAATHSILSNMYEALVAFDKDERLVPALATSWNSLDEHTWQIQLRKGVRFHDGTPLTAADVKYTIERYRDDPASALRGHVSSIEAVEVIDSAALKLRTREPEAQLMTRLTYILILPASRLAEVLRHPIGTGPYKFVGWQKGKALEVAAFDGYWNGRPPIDRALFVPIAEGPSSLEALKGHEVDVLRWIPESMTGEVQATAGVRLKSRLGLSSYYLWFNPARRPGGARSPFSDRRVRQAVSMAMDRNDIVGALSGRALPANQLVQKGVFGYVHDLPDLTYDPDAARRLLQEAGYPGGFDATLVHRTQAALDTVAGVVRDMLRKVGVRITLESPDWPTALARWRAGETPFFLAGWRFEDGEVQSFLRDCLFTREPKRNFGSFNPGYSNPELDRLIEENARILRDDERLKHYERLTRLALEDMPLVPLYHRFNFYGVANGVQWEPRLDGRLLAAEMSFRQP